MATESDTANMLDWLRELLVDVQLESFLTKFSNELHVTRPIHLDYICEEDLERIGVNQSAGRRLFDAAKWKFKLPVTAPNNSVSNFDATNISPNVSPGASAESRPLQRIVAPGLNCFMPSPEVSIFERLGSSAFGTVHRAECRLLKQKMPVAARILSDGCLATTQIGNLDEAVILELNAMHELQHHNVVRFLGIVSPSVSHTLVYEYSELGSLKSCLISPPNAFGEFIITVSMLLTYAVQMVHALKYLESKSYVHGNLAACNVMLSSNDQVKIGDYGLGRALQCRHEFVQMRGPWFAPENFDSHKFTHSSDAWMFGVTLWEMFSAGANPWPGKTVVQVRRLLHNGDRLQRPANCPDKIHEVMLRCWSSRPSDRLRFETILLALNGVLMPVIRSVADYSEGQFEMKNGDDIIVIKGGSDSVMWTGQNSRTGSIGQFPQTLLLPTAASFSAKNAETAASAARSNVKSMALIDLGGDQSLSGHGEQIPTVTVKPAAMAGWTTFESTTDLTASGNKTNATASPPTKLPKEDGPPFVEKPLVEKNFGSEVASFGHPVKDDKPTCRQNRARMREFDMQSAAIDVSDCEQLLPAPSVTSLSEPCSPAHQMSGKSPELMGKALDNMSFEVHDSDSIHPGFSHGVKGSDRPPWTSSASCENLNAGSPQRPAGQSSLCAAVHFSESLSKASSDSHVYVDQGPRAAPPVPPRDYPKRGGGVSSRGRGIAPLPQQHPVIHPILQDGQQRSNTHYWLLPEKKLNVPVACPPAPHGTANHSPYINMTDSQWTHSSGVGNSTTSKHRSASGDTVLRSTASSGVVVEKSAPSAQPSADGTGEESHASMSEACEKMDKVRALLGVESVSSDEVLTALTGHQWSVESAVEYLKVEHLFRLGIASRQVCRAVLDAYRWDLEPAASALLDRCGNR